MLNRLALLAVVFAGALTPVPVPGQASDSGASHSLKSEKRAQVREPGSAVSPPPYTDSP